MRGIRPLAVLLGLADGVWGLYLGLFSKESTVIGASTMMQEPVPDSSEIILVSALLIVCSIPCFLNIRIAFYVSAAIAAVLLARLFISGFPEGFLISLVLFLATVASDIIAARQRTIVPEENHPLNLPVFG